jgi:dehydrogenase/reductase SDR family protein 12
MINKILDASIYWSFDLTGYKRHEKYFTEGFSFEPMANGLITGGTSGIGLACARELAKHEVYIYVTGRDQEKGEAVDQHNPLLHFNQLDMGDWEHIQSYVEKLPLLNYVVLNAGGMPENFTTNQFGVESQFASQLFGHYYLLQALQEQKKLRPGSRVVWVSSGGMYLKGLDLSTIEQNKHYDKVSNYANVKRAQVTILKKLAKMYPLQLIMGMHPGWVDTPAVRDCIPEFYKRMQGRLRSPQQGADTILWLLSSTSSPRSGGFYFDRKKVKKHLFPFTWRSDQKANLLIDILKEKKHP